MCDAPICLLYLVLFFKSQFSIKWRFPSLDVFLKCGCSFVFEIRKLELFKNLIILEPSRRPYDIEWLNYYFS